MNGHKTIDVNECSKLIKRTLKAAFPGVKFSVRLDKYSMGHSIDAQWTDGPTGKQVQAILDRFESSGFDSMTDCGYYCGERIWKGERVDFNAGYVRGRRDHSPAFMRAVAERVAKECGLPAPEVMPSGYLKCDREQRVPFQWHAHWNGDNPLTVCDLLSSKPILVHDSYEGEWLTTLVDKIAQWVSLKPHAEPVELPEYIDVQAKASTGRADFEEPMRKFEGHEALNAEDRAIAEFENVVPIATGYKAGQVPPGFISDKAWSQ